jgi:hypothetical protein
MLLSTVAAVRDRLGFSSMTDINNAITGAMHAAESQLGAVLGTEFGAVSSQADVFWVPEPGFVQGDHVQTEFRLKRGFVTTGTLVAERDTDFLFSAPTAITSEVNISLVKGVVVSYQHNFDVEYVRLTYDAGFAVDGVDSTSYDLSEVPEWLQEAAILQTMVTLETHPSLESAGIKQDTKQLRFQISLMIRPYIRYAPLTLFPL